MHPAAIGPDLAEHVLQARRIDAAGRAVARKKLCRGELLAFFQALLPCLVGMEACGTAHHWAREPAALGRTMRLMPAPHAKA